jgi:AraC-like DNA-binding protein
VNRRPFWEFQAVTRGRIAPTLAGGSAAVRERSLWVFEAGYPHGWTSAPDEVAEILVFHLPAPAEVLQRAVSRRGGWLRVGLKEADLEWLEAEREEFQADWIRPTELTPLKVTRLMVGLSLMCLDRLGWEPRPVGRGLDAERVEKALYWYRQNLGRNPGVEEVARAVGVSAVHLRRIFRKERSRGPKAAFQAIRMEEARNLLGEPGSTVEAVAGRLQFSDASSFTRAYRAHFGKAPRRGRLRPRG